MEQSKTIERLADEVFKLSELPVCEWEPVGSILNRAAYDLYNIASILEWQEIEAAADAEEERILIENGGH